MAKTVHAASEVVIIGAGIAGIVTALELLDRGRRVMLVDRDSGDRLGGLARESFGGMFVVGSREQKRTGIRNSADLGCRRSSRIRRRRHPWSWRLRGDLSRHLYPQAHAPLRGISHRVVALVSPSILENPGSPVPSLSLGR